MKSFSKLSLAFLVATAVPDILFSMDQTQKIEIFKGIPILFVSPCDVILAKIDDSSLTFQDVINASQGSKESFEKTQFYLNQSLPPRTLAFLDTILDHQKLDISGSPDGQNFSLVISYSQNSYPWVNDACGNEDWFAIKLPNDQHHSLLESAKALNKAFQNPSRVSENGNCQLGASTLVLKNGHISMERISPMILHQFSKYLRCCK